MAVVTNKVVKESKYWKSEVEICRIEKSEKTDIVFSACVSDDGSKVVSIREFYIKNDEWLPSKKGYAFKVENSQDIIEAINQVVQELDNL